MLLEQTIDLPAIAVELSAKGTDVAARFSQRRYQLLLADRHGGPALTPTLGGKRLTDHGRRFVDLGLGQKQAANADRYLFGAWLAEQRHALHDAPQLANVHRPIVDDKLLERVSAPTGERR